MSRISDELRDYCKKVLRYTHYYDKFLYFAERIDAEMVELPLSADGYVWTGREVCFWTGSADEDRHKFYGLNYADGMWCVEDKDFERYPAVSVWYERPDSWESIADELEEWSEDNRVNGDDEIFSRAREIADRIRKLAKESGHES